MSSRGVAPRPLLCGTGNSADARVSSRRAPRPHDTSLRHRVAGLLACCRTQPRALCASTSNAPRGPVELDAFFNRADELARLQRLLGSPPTSVLVLTGPPSCGKSALLKHLVSKTDKPPKPSIIDCRAGDYLSPASFSVNLLKCMSNDWKLRASRLLRLLIPSSARLAGEAAGVEVTLDYVEQELQNRPTPLQVIIGAYSKLVKEAKQKRSPGDPWPVIIVDEANALQEWEDAKSLKALLKLFVYLTKQEQLAHVVLATSDTFLVEWLESGPVKASFRRPIVVGNLSRDEAHDFFLQHVLPMFSGTPPDACSAWERVYEVCGGNPGLLYICASDAAAFGSWETACASIVQTAATDIAKGLRPSTWEGAAWTADDCRTVLHMIASSPHAAVSVAQLGAALGEDGSNKLQSMNKMNLLLRRSYDPLARDIDAAAFGPKKQDVYTLPSAAHVCAARVELDLE